MVVKFLKCLGFFTRDEQQRQKGVSSSWMFHDLFGVSQKYASWTCVEMSQEK